MPHNNYPYGYILSPDGSLTPMPEPAHDNGTFSLVQLQEAVEGLIELIKPDWLFSLAPLMWPFGLTVHDIDYEDPQLILLVNEEGKLKDLTPNFVAPRLVNSTVLLGNLVVIPKETME